MKKLPPVHPGEILLEDFMKPLGCYFGTTPGIWLRLQARYDLEVAQNRFGEQIHREVKVLEAAHSTGG